MKEIKIEQNRAFTIVVSDNEDGELHIKQQSDIRNDFVIVEPENVQKVIGALQSITPPSSQVTWEEAEDAARRHRIDTQVRRSIKDTVSEDEFCECVEEAYVKGFEEATRYPLHPPMEWVKVEDALQERIDPDWGADTANQRYDHGSEFDAFVSGFESTIEYVKRQFQRYPFTQKVDWIKIEDGFPERGKGVFVQLSNGMVTVGYLKKDERAWQLYGDLNSSLGVEAGDYVTHWQPLPKTPDK